MDDPGGGWSRQTKVPVEDCLALATTDLRQQGLLFDGAYQLGSWVWQQSAQGAPLLAVKYEINIRRDGQGSLWVWYVLDAGHIHQCIGLTSTTPQFGGRRWWFICPISELRVRKLYLPPGAQQFASRKAFQLTYRSCQESEKVAQRRKRLAAWLDRDEAEPYGH